MMKRVSIQEMRFEFAGMRAALEARVELVLTFRNRPLSRLLPFASPVAAAGVDPALQFGDESESIELLSNTQMDAVIYG